jgi:hypothetical protein
MLKREIKYEDFDGNEVSDTYYFNMTRTEWLEFNAEYEGGLEAVFKRVVDTKDMKQMITILKNFILTSYGIKSEDGKRFIKNDKVREEFTQTPAYDVLFMDFATNDNAALDFIKGIIPKEFAEEFNKEISQAQVATVLKTVEPTKE